MRLYLCDLKELTDAALFDAASLKVDEARKENLKRLKNLADLRRSVGAGLLLAYAFWQYRSRPQEFFAEGGRFSMEEASIEELSIQELLSVPCQDFTYRKTKSGKPYLEGEKDFFFSLSHSGQYAFCACAPVCIGADIQLMERTPKETLAARIMAQGEYEAYKKLPETEKKQEFYRIWTSKESCCKLTGRGLAQDFRKMEISADGDEIYMREEERMAYCRSFVWKENYWIAVSCMEEE